MKVGSDSVLLGSWINIGSSSSALDIGVGCGILSLMLAQRSENLKIFGVELDADAALQAQENVSKSPWPDRIEIKKCDIRFYKSNNKFDLIISNPPFFASTTFIEDEARRRARENQSLSHNDLLRSVCSYLSEGGLFNVVLPYSSCSDFIYKAWEKGLYIQRQTNVYSKKGKNPKRVLLEFSFKKTDNILYDNLFLADENGNKTHEYIELTKAFYLD